MDDYLCDRSEPDVSVKGNIWENIRHILGVMRMITEKRSPGTNGLVNDFQGLVKELQTLRETHFGVNAQLTE